MKLTLLWLVALSAFSQDAVTFTMKSTTDGTTRTIALSGEAATAIIQASEYVAKTSCQPTCQYVNNVDVIRQNLAAFAVAILATVPGAKLAILTAAQKAAQIALDDEAKRIQDSIKSVAITETKP